jgi:hypothetical protein
MVLGQALAYAVMVPIAEVGVDYGLTARWPRGRRSASGARACSARRTA